MNISRRPLLLYALRLGRIVRTSRPHPILSSLKLRSTDSLEVHFSSSTQENNNKQKAPIFREVDEHGFQIPIEDSTRYTDEEKAHRKKMARQYSLLIASLIGFISSSFLLYKRMLNVEAKFVEDGAATRSEDHAGQEDSDSGKKEEEIALHKSKAGFRERKIIEYENRIRAYSTPDKVFRYFATLQDAETGFIFMTPEDFVRSLTPDTMQPEGYGLDSFHKFDRKSKHHKYENSYFGDASIFKCFGERGLISFSDYIFLLTVLGTPTRHIDIAFRMFDLNGDGDVSLEEFIKVKAIFLTMTSTGARHRDRSTTGNVLHEDTHSGILAYFFGEDGKGKLTVGEFVNFKRKLQQQVMRLEFESYNPQNDRIKEAEFAEILMTYASLTDKQRKKKIKKVKQRFVGDNADGIMFKDYLDFFSFLVNIRDVDMALSFHTVAGQAIDPATFKHVALTVAGVSLRDHLVDVVFTLFDENDDGHLSNIEFVSVMKNKLFRGLNKPKDTGLTRFLSSILKCAKQHIPDYWTDPTK